MKKSLLRDAMNIALKKLDNHHEKYKHWTFIVQHNRIVDWATNNSGTSPLVLRYKKLGKDKSFMPKTHAELAAWKKSKGIMDNGPFEAINIRLSKKGQMLISAPCICCYGFLKEMGCSSVYFTTKSGWSKVKCNI